MSTFENDGKPSLSQIKPLNTSEVTELDGPTLAAAEQNDRLRGKLVLRPWRTRYVISPYSRYFVVLIIHVYQLDSALLLTYALSLCIKNIPILTLLPPLKQTIFLSFKKLTTGSGISSLHSLTNNS